MDSQKPCALRVCADTAWWAALMGLALQVHAGDLALLTNVAQVKQLTPEQAALGYPVRLRAVVTFHNHHRDCFVMDASGGVFLLRKHAPLLLEPGQAVEVEGVTAPGDYAPLVREQKVRILGGTNLPPARRVSFDQLASGQMDCQFVGVEGIVREAFWVGNSHLQLHVATGGGVLRCFLYDFPKVNTAPMVDSVVSLQGAVGGRFNQKRQLIAPLLFVNGTNNLAVLKRAPNEPFAAPLCSVRSLLQFHPHGAPGHRVRVRGVVTCERPGQSLFIRDEEQGLYVQTGERFAVQPGDVVEVLGFPAMEQYSPFLQHAVFRRIGFGPLPQAIKTTAGKILDGEHDADLVSLEAELLDQIRRGEERVLVLQAGDVTFNGYLVDSTAEAASESLRNGSRLQLTGICRIHEVAERFAKFTPRSFQLLLRSSQDIVVLQRPSWWTPQRMLWLLGGMSIIFLMVLVWVVMLKRRVAEQTVIIRQRLQREAALEERTRIARELHDTLEQELAGIAIQLDAVAAKWPHSPDKAAQSMEMARRMIRRSQAEARRSVWDLRSVALENCDLPTALAEVGSQIINGSRVEIETRVRGSARRLPGPVESNLLRIGQEAVTNAIKHSGCHRIEIELDYAPDQVRLRIQDDGQGFETATAAGGNGTASCHFGLLGMRERADKLGGTLALQSRRSGGTEILVEVPLTHEEK